MPVESFFQSLFPDLNLYLRVARFLIAFSVGAAATRTVLMPLVGRLVSSRTRDEVSIHSFSNTAGAIGLFLSFIFALQAGQFGNLVTVLGAITAALTVAVGFGMRDQVANMVAGFFIYTDNPFVKGDYIEVGENQGVVREIKLRQTVIRGSSGQKTVLPNGYLTTNAVNNYTKGDRTGISISLKILPEKAGELGEIMLEAAEEEEKVLEKPSPEARYMEMDEKLEIELECWIRGSENARDTRERLLRSVVSRAAEEGILEKKDEK